MISLEQIQYLLGGGGRVVGPDGDKLGNVGHVYLDDESGKPEWVTVITGIFSGSESLVPLAEGILSGDQITVPYDKDKVKDAPRVKDSEDRLSKDRESELYDYYGIGCSRVRSGSGLPNGELNSGTTTGGAMTPFRQEVQTEADKVTTGKSRLRKFDVTDSVTPTDPLSTKASESGASPRREELSR